MELKTQTNLTLFQCLIFIFYCLIMSSSFVSHAAQSFTKINTIEDDLLLLDVRLNKKFIASSIDAYKYQEHILVAIDPLFDALSLKYQLYSDKLIIWKGQSEFTLSLNQKGQSDFFKENNGDNTQAYWARDDFYLYIDTETLATFFDVEIRSNTFQLKLTILNDSKKVNYQFPIQELALQQTQRALAALSQQKQQKEKKAPEITIADQYRLITMPHGRVNTSLSLNNKNSNSESSVQLTSDLFYHAADLTLSKTGDKPLSSRLKLSRYKMKPDEFILGAFDSYSFGDVSGFSNNLTTDSSSGLGVVFERTPENYRRRNLAITLRETAPPNWEAELFHNNQFIRLTEVPDNGLLVFEDVLTEFGRNYYQIKLYGPFGETQTIEKYIDLTTNALAEGAVAYDLYALDRNHRIIDDQSNAERGITNFGGTFDYGISDQWQIGLGYSHIDNISQDSSQFFSLKNALSFPGYLIENDISINDQGGYAQLTTATGTAFGNNTYSLAYRSARDYESQRVKAKGTSLDNFNAGYSGRLWNWGWAFSGGYQQQDGQKGWQVDNRLTKSFGQLYFTHSLNYSNFENEVLLNTDQQLEDIEPDLTKIKIVNKNLTGSFNLSGNVMDSVRISSSINYDPSESSPILTSSSVKLTWNPKFFGINNYFSTRYSPLSEGSNKWQLSHRVSWQSKKFHFTFASNYNENKDWSFNAGIRFFLGYDYHNNRAIFRSNISSATATLDIHTYLDRQMNGVPDPIDYNLEGVSFIGNPDWDGIYSGESGKTILPGALSGGAFRFEGNWKDGSRSINNDYVVYTHPGALIDVNMPFNLTSEIIGFVERSNNSVPLKNVKVELVGKNLRIEKTTDEDGYFEFINLTPGSYVVKVVDQYLQDKGYTSDIVGYKVTTLSGGGFVELDTILLRRQKSLTDVLSEKVIDFELTEDNSEAIIREDNESKRKDYFNLPVKKHIKTKHLLSQVEPKEPQDKLLAHPNHKKNLPKLAISNGLLSTVSDFSKFNENDSQLLPSVNIVINDSLFNAKQDSVKIKTSPLNNLFSFTIQLGVFNKELQAKTFINSLNVDKKELETFIDYSQKIPFYRVFIGRFETKSAGKEYAQKNLSLIQYYVREYPTKEKTLKVQPLNDTARLKGGWVIQFYASKRAIIKSNIDNNYSKIEELFVGQKIIPSQSNSTLYCLMSQIYPNKKAAIIAKDNLQVAGWVTESNIYTQIKKIK
ncbi:MAG: hypothetical protein ACI9LM_004882 [Alteromonadaceae bacterium]|jgi:hypothetical protein